VFATDVDPDVPFFAAGGDSLGLLRVHQDIQELPGTEVPLAQLFQYPSIRELATALAEHPGQAGQAAPAAGRGQHLAASARRPDASRRRLAAKGQEAPRSRRAPTNCPSVG
jgi:acyl carrier protein